MKRTITNRFIVCVLSLLSISGLRAQQVINDPNVEKRDAHGFHAVQLSHAFDVYLSQGNEESVAVSASDSKYNQEITVDVRDGVLVIDYKPSIKREKGSKKLKAYISFKDLDKLSISGACDVYVIGSWKASDLKLDLSGASNLKAKISADKLMINLSGASDLTLSGSVGQSDIETSGASDFKGYDFETDFCNARASGASDIKITVNKELSADASGASDVKYKGAATIRDLKTSGASSVSRKS